ncbi:MAG: hypothetical protein IPM53_31005 [Anaerolineaceae bacterium]|nr:hypothetical protein [Anaerolineaceae bacterium]
MRPTAAAVSPTPSLPATDRPQPTELPATLPPRPTAAPTSPPLTSEQELANLVAFARLYGVVRYFHASDQVDAVRNWDQVVMRGIEAVRDSTTPDELARRLNDYFAPLAPTVLVISGEPDETAVFQPDTAPEQLIMWEHYGVDADNLYPLYTSKRVRTMAGNPSDSFHDPARPYLQPLGGGLTAVVPLAVYVQGGKTQPAISTDASLNQATSHAQQTEYLASVIMFWAITQHFYPYFDVIDADWNASLGQALAAILNTTTEAEWEIALQQLVADLDDGHGRITDLTESNPAIYSPFISLGWVEEQVVVTGTFAGARNLVEVGDIVLKIGAETAVDRLQEEMNLISGATAQFKRHLALQRVLAGQRYSSATLTVQHADGTEETLMLERDTLLNLIPPNERPANYSEVAPGVYYINLPTAVESTIEMELAQFEGANGLIFDLRGYPTVEPGFMELVISDTVSTAQFLIPQTTWPNRENVTYDNRAWTMEPRLEAPLSENIVFLTNGQAISYAETLMAVVAHYQIGEIVGEPTAGTNGNINRIELPSGHAVFWTGMLVLNHDGSQHHGVGVQPTVPVSQTLADLRQGIDTQLQAAITLIEQKR